MSTTYLQRYLNGEYEQVWAELYTLGESIRDKSLFEQAQAVANETMRRARYNISVLVERLHTLDYRFAHPKKNGWRPAGTAEQVAINQVEKRCGLLPLSLKTWYTQVGEVDFMGYHPSLSTYKGELGNSAVITYADPLVVFFNDKPFPFFYDEEGEEHPAPPYMLTLAPCYFHKSNYSGSGGVHIRIPNAAIDAPLFDDADYWTGTPFMSFLRICFKWGGFAGFERCKESVSLVQKELDFLTKDLLPL